jgi:hypothetical protein
MRGRVSACGRARKVVGWPKWGWTAAGWEGVGWLTPRSTLTWERAWAGRASIGSDAAAALGSVGTGGSIRTACLWVDVEGEQ